MCVGTAKLVQARAKAKKTCFLLDFAERSQTCAKRNLQQMRGNNKKTKFLLAARQPGMSVLDLCFRANIYA